MVVNSYMGGYGDMGMDGMGGMGMENEGFSLSSIPGVSGIIEFVNSLPPWLGTLVTIAAIMALAWVVGIIVGKVYSAIRYPDPDKVRVLNAPMRFVFLGVAVVMVILMYVTLTAEPDVEDMPVDGDMPGVEQPMTGDYDNNSPNVGVAVPEISVAKPMPAIG